MDKHQHFYTWYPLGGNEEKIELIITHKNLVYGIHPLYAAKIARLFADHQEEDYKHCSDAFGPFEE